MWVVQFYIGSNSKDLTLNTQCAYLGMWRAPACNSVWVTANHRRDISFYVTVKPVTSLSWNYELTFPKFEITVMPLTKTDTTFLSSIVTTDNVQPPPPPIPFLVFAPIKQLVSDWNINAKSYTSILYSQT